MRHRSACMFPATMDKLLHNYYSTVYNISFIKLSIRDNFTRTHKAKDMGKSTEYTLYVGR
jgi:hypothetical protein